MFSNKKILIVIFTAIFFNSISAQTKVIDIWKGKVPNSIYNPGVKPVIDSANNWIKRKNVTDPTLEMYAAEKNNANGTAVIICPGGGYSALAIIHEDAQVAKWLNSLGVTAFVLNYRLPDDAIMKDKSIAALQDAQQAMRIIRLHAKEWNINPGKIGIMGFSAGKHVAATLAAHFNDKVYQTKDSISARPNFTVYERAGNHHLYFSDPTTFNETIALEGKVGEYVSIVRRKGDTWFVGGLSNWSVRDMKIDLSFLDEGTYSAEIFKDGINAGKDATDYKREIVKVISIDKLIINMANGGGFAIIISPKK